MCTAEHVQLHWRLQAFTGVTEVFHYSHTTCIKFVLACNPTTTSAGVSCVLIGCCMLFKVAFRTPKLTWSDAFQLHRHCGCGYRAVFKGASGHIAQRLERQTCWQTTSGKLMVLLWRMMSLLCWLLPLRPCACIATGSKGTRSVTPASTPVPASIADTC